MKLHGSAINQELPIVLDPASASATVETRKGGIEIIEIDLAGTVEAVVNPVVASMYPKNKTKMLTILHAGWAGGVALCGAIVMTLGLVGGVDWKTKVSLLLIPTVLYALMLLKRKFPVNERVAAGVPYRDMLKEAGALGCLIVTYMIIMEINRVCQFDNLVKTDVLNLPNAWLTGVMVVIVGGYLIYTRTLGRLMYAFLLIVMIMLAITELGTDGWMKELRDPAMKKIGLDGGWILVQPQDHHPGRLADGRGNARGQREYRRFTRMTACPCASPRNGLCR